MGQVSCVPPFVLWALFRSARTLAGPSLAAFWHARQQPQGQEIRTNCLMSRTKYVSLGDLLDSMHSGVTAREAEPGLDLRDLGAAHRDAMRRRAIELDDRAVTLLAHEGHMRDGYDVATMHPDEQTRVELGLGFRDRPWAHPLPGAVMDPGVMGVGPHASDIGGVDEVGAVGAFDRQPRRRRCAGRLANAAERRWPQPRAGRRHAGVCRWNLGLGAGRFKCSHHFGRCYCLLA